MSITVIDLCLTKKKILCFTVHIVLISTKFIHAQLGPTPACMYIRKRMDCTTNRVAFVSIALLLTVINVVLCKGTPRAFNCQNRRGPLRSPVLQSTSGGVLLNGVDDVTVIAVHVSCLQV